MAAMLPQHDPPPRSSYEFSPSSPPEQGMMHQTQHATGVENIMSPSIHSQLPLDFRKTGAAGYTDGNGPLPMANVAQTQGPNGAPRHGSTMSLGGFPASRSPPAAKNTSHVPCKFFRTGQCQAGRACPFSHSTDISSVDTPCKYFAKGNCKFGQKCALAHILPNGRRVNRPNGAAAGNVNIGQRIDPQLYQQSDPMLVQSLLAQQANGVPPPFNTQIPTFIEPEGALQEGYISRPYEQGALRDNGYASHPDSKYGSPREDSRFLSLSPSARLSVLDAPLPASFDSQGISYMARHGPVAASLPSKIGIFESSPPASLSKKAPIPLDSVSNIGGSGFVGRGSRAQGPDLGSSPFGSGDEGLGPRFMHSTRHSKSKLLSTSMPRVDIPIEDSDDDAFHFSGGEEDYIPTSIHDQVLTTDEQRRRYSRTENDRRLARESLSGIGTPNDSSSKVSSPTTGSPSRYGPLFARQQQQQQQESNSNLATSPSAFGHVGSPLRKSSLHPSTSPSLRAASKSASGDLSPSFPSLSSPPRQSSMSVLSQQLSRTRLSSKGSAEATGDSSTTNPSALYPGHSSTSIATSTATAGGIRYPSNTSTSSSTSNPSNSGNRTVSASNYSHGQGRNTSRIDEESEHEHVDGVFSMEDDFEDSQRKRFNGITANPVQGSSQRPPAWSAIAAGATSGGKLSTTTGGGGQKPGVGVGAIGSRKS